MSYWSKHTYSYTKILKKDFSVPLRQKKKQNKLNGVPLREIEVKYEDL
jgi:hypothetical protein